MSNNSLITKYGWKAVLDRYVNDSSTYKPPLYFQVGYSQSDVTVDSTELDNPVPISGFDTIDVCDTTGWTELNDAIAETVNSTSGQFKQGAGCLNLGKSGAVSVNFGYEKNQSSTDFTSKTLYIWFYVADTDDLASSTAVRLIFGSDSFNYYYTDYDRADLSDGWNLLTVVQSTASTQGSPVVGSCNYTSLRMTTPLAADTISIGDIRMDFWITATAANLQKAFITTPPTVDYTNFEITYECLLEQNDAVGYLLDGFVIIDADGNVHSIDKYAGSSKGPTDQFTYEVVDRIEQ